MNVDSYREQLDMVVMGKLHALCRRDPLTQKNKTQNSERKRTLTPYHFQGYRVGSDTFVFQLLHDSKLSNNTRWRRECVHEVEPRCSLTLHLSCPTLRMLSGRRVHPSVRSGPPHSPSWQDTWLQE